MALRKYRKALRYLDICWEKEGIDEGMLPFATIYFTLQCNVQQLCYKCTSHPLHMISRFIFGFAEKSSGLRKTKSHIFTNSSVSWNLLLHFSDKFKVHV